MSEAPVKRKEEFSIIGKRNPKIDALSKVTGVARYADDLNLPRMAWGRVLRSPHAHARILRLDTSRAEALEGVYAVVTGADVPHTYGIMPTTQDEYPLALDKVRYVGDAVAAVAAVDEWTAERALALIEVEYEVLPPILTIEEALEREDVKIHDTRRPNNIFKEAHLEFGDMEAGFAEADLIRDDDFFFEGNNHAPMETHSAVAYSDPDGKLTIWSSTQVPHYLHRETAKVFGMPPSHIRIIVPPVGGGFGGKSDPFSHEIAAAALSMRCGRPVKFTLDREEVFYAHRGRHPVKMKVKTGVKKDGTITAVHFQSFLDGGAYASYGIATTYYTGALLTTTYQIPNYKFDGIRVYTNKPACGPKRGHGSTQPRWAFECQLDKLATELGIDPVEIRRRNMVEPFSRTVNQLRITSMGLPQALDQATERSHWAEKHGQLPYGRGIGLAASAYLSGAGLAIYWNPMPHSGAQIKLDRGGGVTVFCGVADIGQGCDSTLAYVVAEELGVDVSDVRVVWGDTDLTPVDLGSYSSRVTFMAGNAAREAAEKLKVLLYEMASEKLDVPINRLSSAWRRIFDVENPDNFIPFAEAVQIAEARYGTLGSTGSYAPPNLAGDYKGSGVGPSPAYSYSACVAEVTVDPDTGIVTADKIWVAHDCGRALNPANVEGQIEGSAYMALGETFMEEQVFRGGLHKKPSLLEYRLPTTLDTPDIEAIIVETIDPEGPFGAKEAGEGPLNPVIPALTNAVYDAIGIRFDRLPINPDRVLRALADQKKRGSK